MPHLPRRRQRLHRQAAQRCRRRAEPCREDRGQGLRRCRRSAARLGPLGRRGVDARHDGYRAQPRPQRRHRCRAGQHQRRRTLRLGQLPPLHPDVWRCRARRRSRPVRGSARNRQGRPGLLRRYRAERRRMEGAGRRIQGDRRARAGLAVPAGPGRAAVGCDQRGVRQLGYRARQDLPPPQRHPA